MVNLIPLCGKEKIMSFGWQGNLVRLVPLDYDRHFENCLAWINDPEISQFLLVDGPMSRAAEDEWFRSAAKGSATDVHFAIETLDGEHIGNSGIHGISHRHKYCNTGSLIGRKDLWGKGFGTDAARIRAKYVFEILGMEVAFSSVIEGNPRSLRMQEKAGYEVYGVAPKKFFKFGERRDEILTVLTREKWLSLQSA